MSPIAMFSFFRTSFLTGSRNVPDLLSEKIEVFQADLPMDASTRSDPKPCFGPVETSLRVA